MKNVLKSIQVFSVLIFLLALVSNSYAAHLANKNIAFSSNVGIKSLGGNPIKPLLRLRLVKDTTNYDEILIVLDTSANAKYVAGEDAVDFGGIGALESLSVLSSDSIPLAISYVPYPGIEQEVIPLSVNAKSSGTYRLNKPELSSLPEQYGVWLVDAYLKDTINLRNISSCSFTIDKNNTDTFGTKRFSVIIGQNPKFAYALLDFSGVKASDKKQVDLSWKMKNNSDDLTFKIERSIDSGKTYKILGTLAGTGQGDYKFSDEHPEMGQNRYRLEMMDLNDVISYSKDTSIVFGLPSTIVSVNQMKIYPNPSTTVINLAIESPTPNNHYKIGFMDLSGSLVKEMVSSDSSLQVDISHLRPGIYYVLITNSSNNSFVAKSKFIKPY